MAAVLLPRVAAAAACGSIITAIKSSWELGRMVRKKHLDQRVLKEDSKEMRNLVLDLQLLFVDDIMTEEERDKWYDKLLTALAEKDPVAIQKIKTHVRLLRDRERTTRESITRRNSLRNRGHRHSPDGPSRGRRDSNSPSQRSESQFRGRRYTVSSPENVASARFGAVDGVVEKRVRFKRPARLDLSREGSRTDSPSRASERRPTPYLPPTPVRGYLTPSPYEERSFVEELRRGSTSSASGDKVAVGDVDKGSRRGSAASASSSTSNRRRSSTFNGSSFPSAIEEVDEPHTSRGVSSPPPAGASVRGRSRDRGSGSWRRYSSRCESVDDDCEICRQAARAAKGDVRKTQTW